MRRHFGLSARRSGPACVLWRPVWPRAARVVRGYQRRALVNSRSAQHSTVQRSRVMARRSRIARLLLVMTIAVGMLLSVATARPHVSKTATPTPTPTTKAPTEAPTETPEATTAAPTANATAEPEVGTVAPAETEAPVSTATVCTAEQLDTLAQLADNNPYLRSTCSTAGGVPDYVFPVNGVLTFAQLIAMSGSAACQTYFQAVLVVETSECQVANVFVLSTAEAILALSLAAPSYPTESQVTAAIAARAAEYTSASGSTASLGWTLPSVDELQQDLGTNLLINAELQIVGAAYTGSDNGETSSGGVSSSSSSSSSSASPTSSSASAASSAASTRVVSAALALLAALSLSTI